MAARMRESFLRELMSLHPVVGKGGEKSFEEHERSFNDKDNLCKQQNNEERFKIIEINLLSDSNTNSNGQIISASFVACDTRFKNIILSDLNTPIGMQSSALLRLDDVVSITYR